MTAPARMPFAVFRVDGGSIIGGGHIVRCQAIAAALKSAGWRCGIAATAETIAFFKDFSATYTDIFAVDEDEAKSMKARWPEGCDLLVVDHYGRDAVFETSCRPWARRILVIDELMDRRHHCDLLHDGTVDRNPDAYRDLIPENCERIFGLDYIPLRSEFARLRRRLLPRKRPTLPWRVLLSVSTASRDEIAVSLLDGLAQSGLALTVDVVVGGKPQDQSLQSRLKAMGGRLHVATNNMASLIANADIAIGAAGMAGWERCCLGLPSIVFVLAENQRANAEALVAAGAARLLTDPKDPKAIAALVQALTEDPSVWEEMSKAASSMCDGFGAARIRERIEVAVHDANGSPVRLRPALSSDAETILDWQKHPTTRKFSRNSSVPSLKEHLSWFEAKRSDPRCSFNMILCGDNLAGVVRLDRMDDPDTFEVSIMVAPQHRRAGISRVALALARKLVPDVDLWAFVLPENEASLALFDTAGYEKSARPNWYVHYGEKAAIFAG